MRTLVLVLSIFLLLCGALLAANSDDGYMGPNNLRHNSAITTYRENAKGIPEFVQGKLLQTKALKGSEFQAAISFFDENKGAFRMQNPSEELSLSRIDQDKLGMRHVRLNQYYKGIRVIGGEYIAHFSSDGELKVVNGNYEPYLNLEVSPSYSSSQATQIASEDLRSFFGEGKPDKAEMVIFPWEDHYYLAWRLFLYSDTPMGRWEYFVDAQTGQVIYKANRIMNTAAIGTGLGVMGTARNHIDTDLNGSTYQMRDNTRQAGNNPHGHNGQMPAGSYLQTNIASTSLPGSIATDADNYWDNATTQRPAVDGQVYSALVYDWWLQQFDRNSYNDSGATMLTVVNYSAEGDNNAYWDGSRIVVWSWGTGWRSLAGCPDVIAHEWGHAITERTSNLVYEKEPGALNESFSDMMGAAFEWAEDTMDTPDWLMGENGQIGGTGFRSMSDPHAKTDPDYYGTSDPYWVDVNGCSPSSFNDYCGVHTNSGVGNKWFYLLSDGGTHHSITVTGIGVANAIQIAYRANTSYWTSNSDYHNAALGTIYAALDLDSTGAWATETAKAWNAVGVSTPGPSLTFSYPSGVPTTCLPGLPTNFPVVVAGMLGGSPVSGSGQLHYSINDGTYNAISMTETSANHYTATLPAAGCDTTFRFFISADEATNGTFYNPDTLNPFSCLVATATSVVFEDNFQTDKGWTVSGNAADGQWNRGVPAGGGQRGDPPTDFDGSGSCYLTDNVSGNSDVDGGTTTLTSPTFDLSGGNAKIHYARWYSNNFGAAPYADVFNVYISNNNGSSWTLVESVGPTGAEVEGGWYEHTFWVGSLVTPTSQMKLRFDAADLGDGSVVEAAIDAVSVTQFECSGSSFLIVTPSLPNWTQGRPYAQTLQTMGGSGAVTWSDKFDNLAGTGLTISSAGIVSGTPTASGVITFTAHAADEASHQADKQYSFTINAALAITTSSLPSWTIGQPYSQQLAATGGTLPMIWKDKNANLVGSGLSVSLSGQVSGTPTSSGPINFTALIIDLAQDSAEHLYSFAINPAVAITTASVPNWTIGRPYSQQLSATGGTGTINWSDRNSNLLGTGLTISSSGLLSGTPNSARQINFTARATDIANDYDEKAFGFTINPAVQITTTVLPDGDQYQAYSQQLASTGGTNPLTWSDKLDNLAGTGLSLAANGLLSGTPTVSGQLNFTARIVDVAGSENEKALNLTINKSYLCGDANNDGMANVSDAVFIINYVFAPGAPIPDPLESANVNCDTAVNVSDAVFLINFVFLPGSPGPCECK